MSDRDTPLDTLVKLARDARDEAGRALAQEQRARQQADQQLQSLYRYREEYTAKLNEAMNAGIDPATLRNYHQFIGSLDDATVRARQSVDRQAQRVEQARRKWQEESRRLASYDTLIERRAAAERREEQRREQRISDDLVNGRMARQPSPGES